MCLCDDIASNVHIDRIVVCALSHFVATMYSDGEIEYYQAASISAPIPISPTTPVSGTTGSSGLSEEEQHQQQQVAGTPLKYHVSTSNIKVRDNYGSFTRLGLICIVWIGFGQNWA